MADTAVAPEITDLGDKIAKLTIAQAVQLKDYLKEHYKIEPAGGGVMIAPQAGGGGGGGAAAAKPEGQTEVTVGLEGFDAAKKIKVIKAGLGVTGLGIHGAKDFV